MDRNIFSTDNHIEICPNGLPNGLCFQYIIGNKNPLSDRKISFKEFCEMK